MILFLGIVAFCTLLLCWFIWALETTIVVVSIGLIILSFMYLAWYEAILLLLLVIALVPFVVLLYKWVYFHLVDRPERDVYWECFERYKYESEIGCGYEFRSASRPALIGSGYGHVEGEFVCPLETVDEGRVHERLYADVYKRYTKVWPGLRGLNVRVMFDVGFREGVGALGTIPEVLGGVRVWESGWNRELLDSSGEPSGFLVYRISEGLAKCSFRGWGYDVDGEYFSHKFDGGFGMYGRVFSNGWWWVIRPFWGDLVGGEVRRYGDLRDAVDRDMAELVAGLYPGGRDDFEKKVVSRVSETSFRDVMEYEDGADRSIVTWLYFRLFG